MSDIPQGAGWWQASDSKWYPPDLAPGTSTAPPAGMPPTGGPPMAGPPLTDAVPGQTGYAAPGWQQGPPQGFPPAQPTYPGMAASQAHMPPKKSKKGLWIGLGIFGFFCLLLLGGCVAAVFAVRSTSAEFVSALEDISVDEFAVTGVPATGPATCYVTGILDGANGDYAVTAEITNLSGVVSDYKIDYELFGSSNELLGSDFATMFGVEPNETRSEAEEFGFIEVTTPWEDVRCGVISAIRVAS